MFRRAIGNAAPARISKIVHAMINSISVIPDCVRRIIARIGFRVFMPAPCIQALTELDYGCT
jgi:hypothetical protein